MKPPISIFYIDQGHEDEYSISAKKLAAKAQELGHIVDLNVYTIDDYRALYGDLPVTGRTLCRMKSISVMSTLGKYGHCIHIDADSDLLEGIELDDTEDYEWGWVSDVIQVSRPWGHYSWSAYAFYAKSTPAVWDMLTRWQEKLVREMDTGTGDHKSLSESLKESVLNIADITDAFAGRLIFNNETIQCRTPLSWR